MAGYSALAEKKNELIRKGIKGSVFVAPATAPAVTASVLFDVITGELAALPTGYFDLGYTDTVGAKFARAVKATDISSWGSNEPTRSDITSDVTTLVVNAQETKAGTIAVYCGLDPTTLSATVNGVLEIQRPDVVNPFYWRVLAVSVDETNNGEIAICRFLPRALVTAFADQEYSNAANPILYGITFQAFTDSTLGYAVDDFYGGAGWKYLGDDMGVIRVVTVSTTSASPTVVATTGTFNANDVGAAVTGAGIPGGTTIITYTDSTHVVLSASATATASGVALTVKPKL